jgi:hypothetical protein
LPEEALFGAAWDADAEEWVEGEEAEPFMCHLPQNSGENAGEEGETGTVSSNTDAPSTLAPKTVPDSGAKRHCEEGNDEAIHEAVNNLDCFAPLAMTGESGTVSNHCNLPQNSVFLRASATTALNPLASPTAF